MTDTIFFRLLDGVNRPSRLSGAIEELREGGKATDAYSAEPYSLRLVPGSPLAYWIDEGIRHLLSTMPQLQSNGRNALFDKAIGKPAMANLSVTFEAVDGHDICRIDVDPSRTPVYATFK